MIQPELVPQNTTIFCFEPIGGHGGMYQLDIQFFEALAKYGLKLIWATCDETTASDLALYELWTPFRGIYGKAASWKRGMRYAVGLMRLLNRARQHAKKSSVVIHQQYVTVPALEILFVKIARWLGVQTVLTPHDVIPFGEVKKSHRLLPALYKSYDALIVHSQFAFLQLEKLMGSSDNISQIPLGGFNNLNLPALSISTDTARSHLNLLKDVPLILFLGQIKPEKGLEHLIKAMAIVRQKIPNAHLLIAGQPWHNTTAQYESLIKEYDLQQNVTVTWCYVPDHELAHYYRAADVVALPYTHLYQSAACLLAYSFARPVVASNVGGLSEQVIEGTTGYLVQPANSIELANALVRILTQKEKADKMGKNGRAWAEQHANWDKIANDTTALYRRLVIQAQTT